MTEMRKEEKELIKNIKGYLNEKNQTGIRIDDDTYISLKEQDKKISFSKKDHEARVREMLYAKGIDDDDFLASILNKTSNVIKQQKVYVSKDSKK